GGLRFHSWICVFSIHQGTDSLMAYMSSPRVKATALRKVRPKSFFGISDIMQTSSITSHSVRTSAKNGRPNLRGNRSSRSDQGGGAAAGVGRGAAASGGAVDTSGE